MRRGLVISVVFAIDAATHPSAQRPIAPPSDPIASAIDTLGAANLKSVRFTGFGASFSVGQSPNPREPWPRVTVKSYEATIDYDTASMRVEMVRTQGPVQPRGGGQPFTGEQRVVQIVNGEYAWNVPSPTAVRGQGGAPSGALQPDATTRTDLQPTPPVPQPQPAAATERMLQIWLTPHGFVKAATANHASTRSGPGGTEVSFTVGGKYRFTGLINAKNQVERVQTWIDNPVLGDMLVEATYRDYETANGVTFPMHILQQQGGHRALELWVSSVAPNAGLDVPVPDAVRGAGLPPVRVDAQPITDGVYYLTGGSHHSVAVEMRDHIVVIEAPQDEARSLAVIAKVKEVIPNKPIRFVVNTHHHFDHAGGLRTYVDEGATIVTHEMNKGYYEMAWAAPRTLNPDRLSRSRKPPTFETYTDKRVLTDGMRTIEVHRIANSPHHDGFAMVYLPAEKILIEGDAYTPAVDPVAQPSLAPGAAPPAPGPPGPPPPPAALNPGTVNLYENIVRLKLDVRQIAALHGPRLATMDELARAAGRAPD